MDARKLRRTALLIASVCCLSLATTACKRSGSASQSPSASSGVSGATVATTHAPSTVGSTAWVRPAALPRHLAFGEHSGCAVVEPGMADHVPGTVLCWGATSAWSSPRGNPHEIVGPTVLPGLTDIVEIQGSRSMCGRTTRGQVWCWGPQPGTWDPSHSTPWGPFTVSGPALVVGASGATALAVANSTACVVTTEGRVRCWGDNFQGTVGDGTNQKHPKPIDVDVGLIAVGVALDENIGCAWDKDGRASCWGRWGTNAPGNPYRKPTAVARIPKLERLALMQLCATSRDHFVNCWTGAEFAKLLDGSAVLNKPLLELNDAVDVGGASGYRCVLRQTGQLRCWTADARGIIPGEPRLLSQMTPHDLKQPRNVAEFAAGEGRICARLGDASIVCWGAGTSGELGDGQATVRDDPVAIALPSAARASTSGSPAPSRVCRNDQDCGWDHPDKPTQCIAVLADKPTNTRSAGSEIGSCDCQEGHCTWRHPSTAIGVQSVCVDYSDCRYDAEKGACRSRSANDHDSAPYYVTDSPICECHSGTCLKTEVPAVPCKTDDDCWISDEVPRRPIRKPARLRGHKFKGCVDGEVPPRCFGVCGFGPVYGC